MHYDVVPDALAKGIASDPLRASTCHKCLSRPARRTPAKIRQRASFGLRSMVGYIVRLIWCWEADYVLFGHVARDWYST